MADVGKPNAHETLRTRVCFYCRREVGKLEPFQVALVFLDDAGGTVANVIYHMRCQNNDVIAGVAELFPEEDDVDVDDEPEEDVVYMDPHEAVREVLNGLFNLQPRRRRNAR